MKIPLLTEETFHHLINLIVMVILAFVANGVLILLTTGANPLEAYGYLIFGVFGSLRGLTETLVRATPLIFTGLGVAIAFKSRFFNIGAEGQLYVGAAFATSIGLALSGIPGIILFPLFIIFGFIGGCLWGVIPGFLRVRFNVSEIISTLMMNYIAILLLEYLVSPIGPMNDPLTPYPMSPYIPSSIWLPKILPDTRLHGGIAIAVLAAFLLYLFLSKSVFGYRLKAVGASPKAATYAGINVSKTMLISMLISSGLAGIAGAIDLSAIHHRLIAGHSLSVQYGYTAIPVAILSELHPLGVVFSSIFFAGLAVGVDMMARKLGMNVFLSIVMQAIIIIFVISGPPLRRIINQWIKRRE